MQNPAKRKYYWMLWIAVITWGCDPLVNRYLYGYYSAALLSSLSTLASALTFLFLARKRLHCLDRRYLCVALPICLCNSLACVLQRIGLQYTTPARYAFLEHLSCAAVPLILFVCFKRRPSLAQIFASMLCLIGCLVLSGGGAAQPSLGIGDILCAAAGILLGFGIVCTAIYTRGMDITLFTAVHMCTYFLTSVSLALAMHFISVNGAPMERLMLVPSLPALALAILFGLFSVGICWLLRNEATRHISPTAVAVISPFAAVITAVISILRGIESVTPTFLIACALILAAALLAGLCERPQAKSKAKPQASL